MMLAAKASKSRGVSADTISLKNSSILRNFFPTQVERFFAKICVGLLMHKDLKKPQAYPWICRGFLRSLYAQENGADQVKNRSI